MCINVRDSIYVAYKGVLSSPRALYVCSVCVLAKGLPARLVVSLAFVLMPRAYCRGVQ